MEENVESHNDICVTSTAGAAGNQVYICPFLYIMSVYENIVNKLLKESIVNFL